MKVKLIGLIAISLILVVANGFRGKPKQPMEYYGPYLLQELEYCIAELTKIRSNKTDLKLMRSSYHESRKHYKHIELFIEYCSPVESKYSINGPLVLKSDPEYGNKIFYPCGFQAIEEMLFDSENLDTNKLIRLVNDLLIELDKLKIYYQSIDLANEELLEMLQYELYRISSLNLNGYDATITLTGLQETIWCLDGMSELIECFGKSNLANKEVKKLGAVLSRQLDLSKSALMKGKTYNDFNRLPFIQLHINSLNKTIVKYHNATGLPWTQAKRALNLNNEFLFAEESFNMRYFSIYFNDTINLGLKRYIGEKIFFDPIISGNNGRSCATCHNPDLGFTDGFPKSIAMNESDELPRNAPTLLNVSFQQAFFYDGRAYQLEQQIIDVIHNPFEMAGDLTQITRLIQTNKDYKKLFSKAFDGTHDTMITPYAIISCLAEYERSLVSLNSRFDQFLRGDLKAMNSREINGYNLFAGKALCGSCHFFPIFNGTVPPFFNDTEFEILGTPSNANNQSLDPDLGRFNTTGVEIHKFAFKTPTVRNIELTAPYMHNGIYKTLDEVIEFYHKGGGLGFGFEVPNQTLPFDSLQLSITEKEEIVLFLKTLTDTTSYR